MRRILSIWFLLVLLMAAGSVQAQNTDIDILKNINVNRNKLLDPFMLRTSQSVYPIASIVPVAEFAVGAFTKNKDLKYKALQSAIGLGLNYTVAFGLKQVVNRTRPYNKYNFIITYGAHENDASFPSGHTSFAFNTATAISIAFPKWYVAIPAFGWASLVGYSRMHLGMHYPTDVLAGAAIGAGTAWLAWKGNQYLQKKHLSH